ncbi:MAG: IS1595 family transposase [Planctomycetota bacterium]|jgi:transposase-like protein
MVMKTKQTKPGQTNNEVLRDIPLACTNETAAVEFMEKQRWGDMPACPRCGCIDVHKMKSNGGERNKRFLWRCQGCKKQFTVRIGTVFEDSRIPLKIWCYAFWKACASKKGISALQISRECSITYKSALFLMHRIRYAMAEPNRQEKLQGTIEADETYVGGKPRYRWKSKGGRGTKKAPVFAVVKRGGDVRAKVVANVSSKTLGKEIFANVDLQSRLMTDKFKSYRKIGRKFTGGHFAIEHGLGVYARGDIYTNTAESFFALIKRGVYGTFHAVSKKHLHRYVSEFEFRWNHRKIDDGERVAAAIKGADGKRLMYREPTEKSA